MVKQHRRKIVLKLLIAFTLFIVGYAVYFQLHHEEYWQAAGVITTND